MNLEMLNVAVDDSPKFDKPWLAFIDKIFTSEKEVYDLLELF